MDESLHNSNQGWEGFVVKHVEMALVLVIVIGCGTPASADCEVDMNAVNDSVWEIREIGETPQWYRDAASSDSYPQEVYIGDSLWSTEYQVSDTLSIVLYRAGFSWDVETELEGYPSAIYSCSRDTVRIDTNFVGYGGIESSADGDLIFVFRSDSYGGEGLALGDIVSFDLETQEMTTHATGFELPGYELSPSGLLAYSDWDRLWIVSDTNRIVFQGCHVSGTGWPWPYVHGMKWSPDETSLIFEYYGGGKSTNRDRIFEAMRRIVE